MKFKKFKTKYSLTFELPRLDFEKVFVKGDFDGWQEHEMEVKKNVFKVKIDVPVGTESVEYIFKCVDSLGQEIYITDPDAELVQSVFGNNSFMRLK